MKAEVAFMPIYLLSGWIAGHPEQWTSKLMKLSLWPRSVDMVIGWLTRFICQATLDKTHVSHVTTSNKNTLIWGCLADNTRWWLYQNDKTRLISIVSKPIIIVFVVAVFDVVFAKKVRSKKILIKKNQCPKNFMPK